jgi:hypothetical protein
MQLAGGFMKSVPNYIKTNYTKKTPQNLFEGFFLLFVAKTGVEPVTSGL